MDMFFKKLFRGALKLYYHTIFKIKVVGIDNIPKEGGCMICSNHINNQDPLIIGISLKRFMMYMAKKELFKTKFTNWFFRVNGAFPVDRDANDISAIKTSIKTLKSGTPMLMFPEGTKNFTTIPLEVKPGVAMIAVKSKVPVIPITISTSYKPFSKVNLIIGEPIYLDQYFDKRVTSDEYQEISQEIVNNIYKKMVEDGNN